MTKKFPFWSPKNHLLFAIILWIIFSVFYTPFSSLGIWISLLSFALIILFNLPELKKGFVLPWGSVVVFFFLALNQLSHIWPWADIHAFLLSNSVFALIVIFSMIIGKPFTIQYARERTSPETWQKPLFLKINWILTSLWALLTILMALPSYLLSQSQIQDSWFYNYGLALLCNLIGIRCNKWIPEWLKKNKTLE